jgi:hypothetical protein
MARPKKEYTNLNIKLDKEASNMLEAYCSDTGATKTAAVEIAIKHWLSSYSQVNVTKELSRKS